MSAVLTFLKFLYAHKEKIILGAMIIAFAGVAYTQWKSKEDGGAGGRNPDGSTQTGGNNGSPPPRKAQSFKIPVVANRYPLHTYIDVTDEGIFKKPEREEPGKEPEKPKEWAQINVKSIFDATRSGSYIAIIEVNKRRRFVKEGEQFDEYRVERIDGVKNCLTIERRGEEEKREFCKED